MAEPQPDQKAQQAMGEISDVIVSLLRADGQNHIVECSGKHEANRLRP
jgi:hypothetical protein